MFLLLLLKRIIRIRKGFTPLETARQFVKNNMFLTGFTLLEIIIALAIFTLASIGVGGAIVSIQQSWQKQKASVNLVNNARWGMEFIANEIRRAPATSISLITNPDGIKFELPGGPVYEVRYWRGAAGGAYGDPNIIYRGQGVGMANANSARKELVNLVDGASFSYIGNLVTIDLTVKKDNNSFRLKTASRPRN